VLGAGEWRGTPATVWRNVTPVFIYKALNGEPLPVENGGVATRDFIYVDDIVEGLLRCAALGEANGVYNLASGVETSILELAETVNELTGNAAGISLEPARDWDHSGKRYGSPEKAERELGFRADTALRDGLERTVAWTRENLERIDRCISRHADRMV
jgi:nucleoside-diphosphate-sugar epimerase